MPSTSANSTLRATIAGMRAPVRREALQVEPERVAPLLNESLLQLALQLADVLERPRRDEVAPVRHLQGGEWGLCVLHTAGTLLKQLGAVTHVVVLRGQLKLETLKFQLRTCERYELLLSS
jgi:hypothetical protein